VQVARFVKAQIVRDALRHVGHAAFTGSGKPKDWKH